MKNIILATLLLFGKFAYAHTPDLSSLMIYEQNGKYLLIIKSSLTAFQGEVDYIFKKNAYKTPEEFQQLVLKHFQNNCSVIINNETIKFINPQVQLGHETTLFAELDAVPDDIKSINVKNAMFEDMPNNMCELILINKGFVQKQHILSAGNNNEVLLKAENNNWIEEKTSHPISDNADVLIGIGFIIMTCIAGFFVYRKHKNDSKKTLSFN